MRRDEERKRKKEEAEAAAYKARQQAAKKKEEEDKVRLTLRCVCCGARLHLTAAQLAELQKKGLAPKDAAGKQGQVSALPPAIVR